MGISTWWYRGSDMDTGRTLEQRAGRTLTELSIHGNTGFKAQDAGACSVYVAKGGDVITWSIQMMNLASLPDLCSITTHGAADSGPRELARTPLRVVAWRAGDVDVNGVELCGVDPVAFRLSSGQSVDTGDNAL